MNPDSITTPEEAVCHLFFHCCFKDGTFTGDEIKVVSEKLVAAGLNTSLNFKDEVVRYQSYRNSITDEDAYIKNLIAQIRPANELALFSLCVELCLSDGMLQAAEENLLQRLAAVLDLTEEEQSVCKRLMIQRRVVETEKVF